MTATPTATTCPACGAAASGRFCSGCGASLEARACAACRAPLAPQARFCHRCGQQAGTGAAPRPGARSERAPWIVAGILAAVAVGAIGLRAFNDRPPPVPDMANAGAGAGAEGPGGSALAGGPLAGPAPDISQMTPRERFDRLFNRIMSAAERGDSAEMMRFTPMALGAYAQLDPVDADARYHAAILQIAAGNGAAARALADTIQAGTPGHLFGYLIRGTDAEQRNDTAALRRAREGFLRHYDAELKANRVEYMEHRPVIEQFRTQAK